MSQKKPKYVLTNKGLKIIVILMTIGVILALGSIHFGFKIGIWAGMFVLISTAILILVGIERKPIGWHGLSREKVN